MGCALGVVLGAAGCKASVNVETDVALPEYDQPIDAEAEAERREFDTSRHEPAGGEPALNGARPDLLLAGEGLAATCECLAVAVGVPSDPAFFWQGGIPAIGAGQLVVAVSSEGIPCPAAPADAVGATYWGHRQEGADVIVVVEPAGGGRPMTTGAIIPRPGPGGAVYVAPQSASGPYGRPLQMGQKYCRVTAPDGASAVSP